MNTFIYSLGREGMVMMMANTPSLKASNLPLVIVIISN